MLVGREREIERIERLLASARAGESDALVLRGEPGAGKTALLRYGVTQAGSMLVLRATGYESEAELEFSGLVEICRPLLGGLEALPPAQAVALSSALGLTAPSEHDRFAVAAATLSLVAGAAETAPVLVVVDDAHWLDRASLDALLFVARRLVVDPVSFVFATRPEGLAASGLEELVVDGLDPVAAATLAARSAGGTIAPGVLESLLEAAAGNPLGLIELPRQLTTSQRAGREPLFAPVPAGELIERAFAGRLDALGESSRQAVAVLAAADGQEIEPAVVALAALGIGTSELDACEDAAIVTVGGDRFSFAHPLLRSAAYQAVSPSFRRSAHRALAAAVPDVERRAWHLALAAVAPDDEAAAALTDPYLEARTRLGYGERLRRSGRRIEAREQLRAAHETFVRMGCTAWASRTARELRASGERLRTAAASGDELTPQEREIALQVAAGKQNKEVAAALFLSPKTVEFHLSRIYRKLEITSRTELVRQFAGA